MSKISCPISLIPCPKTLYLLFSAIAFLGCAEIPYELREEANGKRFAYCVLDGQQTCISGSFVHSDCNGKPSDNCPYGPRECGGSMFSPSNSFCYNGSVYPKCSGMEYNPTTHICQGYAVSPATCGGRQYNPLEQRCGSNGFVETKCGAGSSYHNPETQFCNGSEVLSKCNGEEYNPLYQRCRSNAVETKCGTGSNYYNPETQFCNGNSTLNKCSGKEYNPSNQRCQNNVIETKCGTSWYSGYNPATQFCYGNSVYSKCSGQNYNPENQRCENNVVEIKCGTGSNYHNPATQFCYGNSVYSKCSGQSYNPENQRCQNNAVETKCGTNWYNYNPSTQFCSDNNIYNKCGGKEYNPSNQRCENNVVETRCGTGSSYYNPLTQFCQAGTNAILSLCGTQTYTSSQFCQSANVVKTLCGTQTYTSSQFCKDGTTLTQYGTATYGGQTYKTVVIGTQTWMAENLNYNVSGSKCYSNSESNCGIYGRLYDWATAMGLEAYCNSSVCNSQIQPKHQGVCPSGWHIPSGAEWQALVDFAGGDETAGTKLKSASGWNAHATYGDGTDDHGFSALPGGFGNSGGYFSDVGD